MSALAQQSYVHRNFRTRSPCVLFWRSSLLSNQLLYNQINECMTSRSSSTLSISTVFPFFIPRFAFVELSLSWHWVHSLSCMDLFASKMARIIDSDRKINWCNLHLSSFFLILSPSNQRNQIPIFSYESHWKLTKINNKETRN